MKGTKEIDHPKLAPEEERMLAKKPLVQCYEVLHQAGCHPGGAGLTAGDLAARCNRRYGARYQGYWGRQLQALADMGYAEMSGRWCNCAPVWVAVPLSSSKGEGDG